MCVWLKTASGSQISRENVYQGMVTSVIEKELHVVLSPKWKLFIYELSCSALENHGCDAWYTWPKLEIKISSLPQFLSKCHCIMWSAIC